MDEVTQQNAALVEEAAAAAESLQDQAAKLSEAVSVFRLEAGAYSVQAEPVFKGSVAAPSQKTKTLAAPVARPKKLAAAGSGGSEEWEEF
jgi:hypothetical protein